MAIFSDLRSDFIILDYLPTHSQLLIRSPKDRNRNYNIDIIFKAVLSFLIPSDFKWLEISIFEMNESKKYLVEDYGFMITKDYKIFSLKNSEGKTYFLNAMAFGVFHNKLDFFKTSLGRYDTRKYSAELILWYPD